MKPTSQRSRGSSALPAKRKSPAVIGAVVLLMLLLGYKLTSAVQEGMAWLYALPASQLMDDWQRSANALEDAGAETTFVPPAEQWQAVLHNSIRAQTLAPGNPVYYANLGRLYDFKLNDKSLAVEDIEALGRETLYYHQQAAKLRPTWAYYWWDIALAEYRLFHFHSPTYQQALQNVAKYGPWFNDAQLFVTELSLETWQSLEPATQESALLTIDRALPRQSKQVKEVIAQYRGWNLLCPEYASDRYPAIKTACLEQGL